MSPPGSSYFDPIPHNVRPQDRDVYRLLERHGLEVYVYEASTSISATQYDLYAHEEVFRDAIKSELCDAFATQAFVKAKFTQIRNAETDSIVVRGQVVIMSLDELKKLIG